MTATEQFGRALRIKRKEKNLSQEKLAEYCGLHATYIGQLERGEKSPTVETVARVADGLGIGLAQFFSDAEHMQATHSEELCSIYSLIESQPLKKQEHILAIVKSLIELL